MEFIRYQSKEQFLKDNLDILLKEEAINNIMIGIILQSSEEKVENWLMARIEENNEIKMILVIEDDKNGLLAYLPNKEITHNICEFLVENIINNGFDLKEIKIQKEFSDIIVETYKNKIGKELEYSYNNYVFQLEKLNSIETEGAILKLADDKYIPQICNNVREIYRDTFKGKECKDEEALEKAKIYIKKGLYILVNENDEIVTQAITARKLINGYAIGAVVTPDNHRGKGYAKKCVYLLCEKMIKEGATVIALCTKTDNEISRHVYEKIGFKVIGEETITKFK